MVKSIQEQHVIPLIVLAGPTAVGKSALAMNLARLLKTDIISADSAQVYKGLDIGSAKPTEQEQQEISHHLIDLVNPDQPYSAADYQQAAEIAITKLWKAGRLPFMVGGTGLYIRAVTDSYAFGKKGASMALRESLSAEADEKGLKMLYERLMEVDPRAAGRIHPNDRRRIIRALEVYILEGKPISEQVTGTERSDSPYVTKIFCLSMDRDLLYEKIDRRVDQMLAKGFLEEVRGLKHKGYSSKDPGMQILGYRQLLSFLEDETTLDDTVAEIKKQTRNLAKRQLTWFRRIEGVTWLEANDEENLLKNTEIICTAVKELTPSRANYNF
jgi:tRNA dimethylallyltransferase